mgnify:CR=1 FL=1
MLYLLDYIVIVLKMYKRKTADVYNILQFVCGIWEVVTCEDNFKQAKITKKEYTENQPEHDCKIVKNRVKKENN